MIEKNPLNLTPNGSFDALVASLREELGFTNISHEEEKRKIALELASFAKNGDRIGLGSGSTSFLATVALAHRVSILKLNTQVVTTSFEITHLALSLGLNVGELGEGKLDWCFDGADEVDSRKRLIKGRGGAMLREKMVLSNAKKAYILVDPSKRVSHLGERFAIPVEVLKEALYPVRRALLELGASEVTLRKAGASKDGPVLTEHGNLILDARFQNIPDELEKRIKSIVGVVDSGLFIGYPQIEILGL